MFQNRQTAGKLIAEKLREYKNFRDCAVAALSRGGVVVGAEIAKELKLPLEIVVVKKLSAPFNPELAIGAVGQNGAKYIDREMVRSLNISDDYLESEIVIKLKEVEERIATYNISSENLIKYSNFLLTDDGIATGATIRAAIAVIQNLGVKKTKHINIVLTVPVVAKEIYDVMINEVDRFIALSVADNLGSVGQYYREFSQVTDDAVIKISKLFTRANL